VDRRAAGVPVDWPLYAAAAVEVANWEADDCDLCRKGTPR
jgi:orotate phosphoribosyltransferase